MNLLLYELSPNRHAVRNRRRQHPAARAFSLMLAEFRYFSPFAPRRPISTFRRTPSIEHSRAGRNPAQTIDGLRSIASSAQAHTGFYREIPVRRSPNRATNNTSPLPLSVPVASFVVTARRRLSTRHSALFTRQSPLPTAPRPPPGLIERQTGALRPSRSPRTIAGNLSAASRRSGEQTRLARGHRSARAPQPASTPDARPEKCRIGERPGSWWAPRSSKPSRGRFAAPGGFDSHPLPSLSTDRRGAHPQRRAPPLSLRPGSLCQSRNPSAEGAALSLQANSAPGST